MGQDLNHFKFPKVSWEHSVDLQRILENLSEFKLLLAQMVLQILVLT